VEYVTVTASTREEAVEQLKKLYGPEIKIFSTKKIDTRTGLMRRKRSLFEVTAYRSTPESEIQKQSSRAPKKSRRSVSDDLYRILEENEFPSFYIEGLLKEAETDSYDEIGEASDRMRTVISRRIDRHRGGRVSPPRISILVGPTGTGKTTTAAKLAAHLGAVRTNKKILLVTIDTYRIGAKAQIETFGELMGVPVHTLKSRAEMVQLLERTRDVDHIIVDTVGRSPRDEKIAPQMLSLLEPCSDVGDVRTLLALPATMKLSDMVKTVERFNQFGLDSLIITKLDETEHLGMLIAALDQISLPVDYLTDGQRVPQDFHVMDRDLLLDQVTLS
jgi:flagellar biosynthesis protein FlhF